MRAAFTPRVRSLTVAAGLAEALETLAREPMEVLLIEAATLGTDAETMQAGLAQLAAAADGASLAVTCGEAAVEALSKSGVGFRLIRKPIALADLIEELDSAASGPAGASVRPAA
jgi:hypothetical protein